MRLLLALFALSSLLGHAATVFADEISLDQLRTARKQAAERPRRIIFNNDGNEPVYLCRDNTPEELLRHRTSPLAGTQVDSIFYCTWSSGFGMFTHDTKVGHVFKTREDLFSRNRIEDMLAAGTDPLRVMTDFGQKNNIEIFWSFRMNDTHDAGLSGYGPVMFRANPLKLAHPDWLIGKPDQRPKFGGWSAVNFSHPEVRDLALKFVEEVCRNYPVHGIELDFFRHPVFFQRAAQTGTSCNDEERALMTQLIRDMRAVTEVEGRKRGTPILLSARVPDSMKYCHDIGLDLETWFQEDLLDLLVTTGYFQLNPWSYSAELGRKYHLPVYPSLDESRVRDESARKLRMSVAAYRGRALAARYSGLPGVYLFNAFNPHHSIWRELGDPDQLVTLPHDYFASIRGVGAAAGGALPHRPDQDAATLNPGAPLPVIFDKPAETEFYTGADLTRTGTNATPQVTLRLQFDKPSPEHLNVEFNGERLSNGKAAGNWMEYALKPEQLPPGKNKVAVQLNEKSSPLKWTDLHCTVRWPVSKPQP